MKNKINESNAITRDQISFLCEELGIIVNKDGIESVLYI